MLLRPTGNSIATRQQGKFNTTCSVGAGGRSQTTEHCAGTFAGQYFRFQLSSMKQTYIQVTGMKM